MERRFLEVMHSQATITIIGEDFQVVCRAVIPQAVHH